MALQQDNCIWNTFSEDSLSSAYIALWDESLYQIAVILFYQMKNFSSPINFNLTLFSKSAAESDLKMFLGVRDF